MERDRISVCVCTFRRPEFLGRLLESLADQVIEHSFCFDVIVVDNDKSRPAQEAVRSFASRTGVATIYDCEPLPAGRDQVPGEFIHHLATGEPLHPTLEMMFNLEVMAILDAGVRSAESGRVEIVENAVWEIG